VLKGKHVKFSSRDELTLIINLSHLRMCNHIELDHLFFFNALIFQINSE